jgi:hypothetical protein
MSTLLLNEGSAPSTPATGKLAVYAKTDGKPYAKNDAGTEFSLANGGGNYRSFWVDAGAMVSRTTGGAATVTEEYATNDIMSDHFLFDGASEENVQFRLSFPTSWDMGTIKVKVYWDAAAGASNGDGVVWGIKAGAYSDDDAIDQAIFGSEVTVADTLSAVGDVHIATSAAITIGSTPIADDMIIFNVARKVSNGSDDMTEDAKLLGIKIQYQESVALASEW